MLIKLPTKLYPNGTNPRMNHMKKLLITLLLLAVVVLIAPKFIGGVVETEHQAAMDKLNANPEFTIKSTTYTRQWFTGKATTEMAIIIEGDEIADITVIIEENLSFGPIIFTDNGVEFALSYSKADINFKDFVIDEEVATFIKNKIHISALLTFSKNIVTNLVIDEVSKELAGNQIASAKASGQFTLENNNRFYGDFTWAGLKITSNDENIVIEKLDFSIDQTLIAGDYFQGNAISIGDFDFSLASLMTKDSSGNTVLNLDNLMVTAMSSVKKDLMKITMNYHADKVATVGQQLENANLAITFNNFNIHVMQEVNTLMSGLSADDEAMFNPDNMQKMSKLITKLLVDDPVIEITDLSVQTPEGKIESSMQVSVDKNLFDTANLMSIMTAVKADANGKAPMPFFDKLGLAQMVEMYVEQGLIIQKEAELSVRVNYIQGQLTVNGKTMPM